uniref:Coiled-coil domain containing 15 n=2 Tax=Ficedula albicollis TaxID=59894 RepID=U3JRY2_FICAL
MSLWLTPGHGWRSHCFFPGRRRGRAVLPCSTRPPGRTPACSRVSLLLSSVGPGLALVQPSQKRSMGSHSSSKLPSSAGQCSRCGAGWRPAGPCPPAPAGRRNQTPAWELWCPWRRVRSCCWQDTTICLLSCCSRAQLQMALGSMMTSTSKLKWKKSVMGQWRTRACLGLLGGHTVNTNLPSNSGLVLTKRKPGSRIKRQKENQRRAEEQRMRDMAELQEPSPGKGAWEALAQLQLEERRVRDRQQRDKEHIRYVEALRAQMREKVKFCNIDLPPLCSCGSDFWDSHPDTCANNCVFYKNHKGRSSCFQRGDIWA